MSFQRLKQSLLVILASGVLFQASAGCKAQLVDSLMTSLSSSLSTAVGSGLQSYVDGLLGA